ncbi:hypothetical protein Slin15195_G029390 [Septoria linicola]|uniref:Uncharacterized protein n=1 Tax=Septoria linicola TaxID=215465 RepID=A0A9Q9EG46_9PEZI|nr:hypothetical protein Slin14017_G028420 [Septoria linicola]USW49620.1 hypothetical protein Slin15195_G029390 [Septoria linicola]
MARCYLDPSNVFAERGLDSLRLWLAGYDRRDVLTNPPPRLSDMHSALMAAVMQIKIRLDPQLEYIVNTATEQQYGMQFDPESFWSERMFNLDAIEEMREAGIRALDRGRTMRYLEEARDEIEWVRNEIRRFEVHLDNAHKLITQKLRQRFVYRATPRKRVEYSLVPYVEEDTIQVKEDEEMLDDEHLAERRARSRTPEPGEMSRYDDDYDFSHGEIKEEGSEDGEGKDAEIKTEQLTSEEALCSDSEEKENQPAEEKGHVHKEGERKDSVLATLSWGYLRL